jgi:hypothetical protein
MIIVIMIVNAMDKALAMGHQKLIKANPVIVMKAIFWQTAH